MISWKLFRPMLTQVAQVAVVLPSKSLTRVSILSVSSAHVLDTDHNISPMPSAAIILKIKTLSQ